jgi:hypothetical protein
MPQRLTRPIRLLVQSRQVEMRVAEQWVLRKRLAIRRDRLFLALEIL